MDAGVGRSWCVGLAVAWLGSLRRPDGGLGSDRFGVRKSCLGALRFVVARRKCRHGALRFVVAHRTGRGDSYIARHVGFDAPCHIWMRHVGQFGAPIAESGGWTPWVSTLPLLSSRAHPAAVAGSSGCRRPLRPAAVAGCCWWFSLLQFVTSCCRSFSTPHLLSGQREGRAAGTQEWQQQGSGAAGLRPGGAVGSQEGQRGVRRGSGKSGAAAGSQERQREVRNGSRNSGRGSGKSGAAAESQERQQQESGTGQKGQRGVRRGSNKGLGRRIAARSGSRNSRGAAGTHEGQQNSRGAAELTRGSVNSRAAAGSRERAGWPHARGRRIGDSRQSVVLPRWSARDPRRRPLL